MRSFLLLKRSSKSIRKKNAHHELQIQQQLLEQREEEEQELDNPVWTDERSSYGVMTAIPSDGPSTFPFVDGNDELSSSSSLPGPASQGDKKGNRGTRRVFLSDLRSMLARRSTASTSEGSLETAAPAVAPTAAASPGSTLAHATTSTPQRGTAGPPQRRLLQRRVPAKANSAPRADQPPHEATESLSHSSAITQPPQSPHLTSSNTNKPLPSPPQPGAGGGTEVAGEAGVAGLGVAGQAVAGVGVAGIRGEGVGAARPKPKIHVKPTLELQRIMPPLTREHVEKLFSGAPQFFARSEGHFTGAPHPSVAFPWDEDVTIRDLTDHIQIEDKAWGCITAWPHITHDVQADHSAARRQSERSIRAHFYPRCRERPNMLSMAGLEKGSMGYQAALEQAVGDALQEEQWGFESLAARPRPIVDQRQRMLAAKDGLRYLDEESILNLLMINGRRYVERHLRERRTSGDLYMELYMHILHPPEHVANSSDPYSLTTQIQSLIKVLGAPNTWIDFSQVSWRIRLGRLLWGLPEDELDSDGDGSTIRSTKTSEESAAELQEERYWLLLQILLACELLIRLDVLTEGDETGMDSVKPSDIHRFEKDTTTPVKWSMILARAWLENIEIVKTESVDPPANQRPKGWLATLTKKMALYPPTPPTRRQADYAIRGKHCERQVDGLKHFTRALKWPDIESQSGRITESCRGVTSGTPGVVTPLASPMSRAESGRTSYFGDTYFGGSQDETRIKHTPSKRRQISAALHPSGWLSKSYVSGFMLPGEGLTHFLMATLLENDEYAMDRLGPMANLCGGFVYREKSFWSQACIVGRVLAAGKGSAECMGWISSDITPRGLVDGWLNIVVADIPSDVQLVNKKARLWGKTIIEKQSHVLGDAEPSSILAGDFILPNESAYREEPVPTGIRIDLKGLVVDDPISSVQSTPAVDDLTPYTETTQGPELLSYHAEVSFTVSHDEMAEPVDYTFSLSSDAQFVTAHPCVPSQHVKIVNSSMSPTIQSVDLGSAGPGKTANVVGHPLHKFYTYLPIHLLDLLAVQDLTLEDILATYKDSKHRPSLAPSSASVAKVLVIDCISGFQPLPQEHEIPLSPVVSRSSQQSQPDAASQGSVDESAAANGNGSSAASVVEPAGQKMHQETRRRQFGSDMEILVRALCAQKGWNALISRRRRGCLACAIREAGALGWKVIIRVD